MSVHDLLAAGPTDTIYFASSHRMLSMQLADLDGTAKAALKVCLKSTGCPLSAPLVELLDLARCQLRIYDDQLYELSCWCVQGSGRPPITIVGVTREMVLLYQCTVRGGLVVPTPTGDAALDAALAARSRDFAPRMWP